MRRRGGRVSKVAAAIAGLALSVAGCVSPTLRSTDAIAIVGGAVVDPTSESRAIRKTIIISGDRISAIVDGERAPSGARIIDARGKYVVPGLWDMHAHLATGDAPTNAPERYVAHGVLGLRDMGGLLAPLQALRRDAAAGRLVPTLMIAGPTLNGEASAPHHRLVRSDGEARIAVRELAAAGVDFIKIHRRTGAEALTAIADETRRLGLRFAGHVPLVMHWPEGAAAGMQSIEHVQALLENELVKADDPVEATFKSLERVEGPRGAEIFRALAGKGTYFTPTLIFFERSWQRDPPERQRMKQQLYARLRPLVGRAARFGVPLLAGSDLLDSQGAGLLDELDRLVLAGLSPREALAAATENGRRVAGRGPGRIAVGEEASLLIVDADPRATLATLRRLDTVVLRGRPVPRAELDALRR